MRYLFKLQFLIVITLGLAAIGWGQGGRGRGAQGQPAGAPAGRGGGGRGAGGSATGFYNFDTSASAGQSIPEGAPSETRQTITVNGQPLAYTARAGYLAIQNATTGNPEAHLFFTSYAKDGTTDAASRPIVFFVGGAPGVATSWQEFGGFGPKRMRPMTEGAEATGGLSYENPNTLLNQADLVFVNPVGTAYSRPAQPGAGPEFWNTAADLASLGEFVRTYLNRYQRRTSPLYVAAEDFGTGRAAGLGAYLNDHQIPVHGVVLLSMTMSNDSQAGDTQYLTLLPSLVMAAWHHKKLSPELNAMSSEQIAGQARQFASREYLHALYNGDRMTADERAKVIANFSRLTGLSKSFVVNNNLRVSLERFSAELLREQRQSLSPSDARVGGFVPVAPGRGGRGGGFGGPAPAIDFNASALGNSFLTAYENYLRRELAFAGNPNGIFYLMSGGVGAFNSTGGDDASLADLFARNPNLRLFVGINYFDLAAPFYAAEYTLAHLSVAPEVRARNIRVSHYDAGQKPYVDTKALVKLQRDLAGFLGEATRK